jgi:release factor glutamine methyltransferase
MLVSSRQLFDEAVTRLGRIYDANEARSIAFLLLESQFGLARAAVLAGKTVAFPDPANWAASLRRLEGHEPVQYVTGLTYFYGLPFRVNPHVLIPRPETEELVEWVVREHAGRPVRLLDVGTGSGCIAVSLAKALPGATVWALDVSPAALQTAQENAALNDVDVRFLEADILQWERAPALAGLPFDVVVSNPPYVTVAEKSQMRANVTDFEPHLALFVPDADPLRFYRVLAAFCRQRLSPGGACYLEINEQFPGPTEAVLREAGLAGTQVHTDLYGKPRHVKAIQPGEWGQNH